MKVKHFKLFIYQLLLLTTCQLSPKLVNGIIKSDGDKIPKISWNKTDGAIRTGGSRGKVQHVEGGVEELVAGAHRKKDGTRGVVDAHDGVLRHVNELVARLALEKSSGDETEMSGDDNVGKLSTF